MAANIKRPPPEAHWRDSARQPRFFIIDAAAAFPILFALLHIRWWTMTIALIATIFFAILYRYGFTIHVFARWLRGVLGGKRKSAIPWWM